jgi:hypothetical protein
MPKFAILVKRYLGQYLLKHGISSPLSSYGLSPTTDPSSVAGDSLFSLLGDQGVDILKSYTGHMKHGISSPLSSYGLSPMTDLSSVAGDSLFSLLGDQEVDILKSELGDFGDTRNSLLDLFNVIYWSFLAIALHTFLGKSYNLSFQI